MCKCSYVKTRMKKENFYRLGEKNGFGSRPMTNMKSDLWAADVVFNDSLAKFNNSTKSNPSDAFIFSKDKKNVLKTCWSYTQLTQILSRNNV